MSADADSQTPDPFAFPCAQCGAKLHFNPNEHALTCPYCGHVESIAQPSQPIVEYDLHEGLARLRSVAPDQLMERGHEVQCQGCGARTVMAHQAQRCSFCGSPVVAVEHPQDTFAPESLLPFRLDQRAASGTFASWAKSRWFAPDDLARQARTVAMDGVYLPHWSYDSQTNTPYRGLRGEHYWETHTYTDANGRRQTRQVMRTRWIPAWGAVDVPFDDVLVCASTSVPESVTRRLEPWDLAELRPYDPAYLSGFIAERYQVDLQDGFGRAQERMEPRIRAAICRDIGGDTQQISSMSIQHRDTKFKLVLLPLWISTYHYRDKLYRVIVNARTGEVVAERPWSIAKIVLAVLAVAALALAVWWFTNGPR